MILTEDGEIDMKLRMAISRAVGLSPVPQGKGLSASDCVGDRP
jgi:hypothetical protein